MKLSSVITSLLAVSPLTQASLLRSKQEKTFKTSKVQIVIQGVPQDFSKEDLSVINKSAISAYNAVQQDSRHSLVAIKPVLHFGGGDSPLGCLMCPPDDDNLSLGEEQVLLADVKVQSSPLGCLMCPPDDDTVALEESSNHKLFELSFCNLLAVSGAPNLAMARDCSFAFLEDPGHGVAPLSLVKPDAKKGEGALGFLSLTGLLTDLSPADVSIVESATLETFNQAFANVAGYSEFKALTVRSAIDAPKVGAKCQQCPPDDDYYPDDDVSAASVGAGRCMMCPPDDDSIFSAPVEAKCQQCPPDDDYYPDDDVSTSRAGLTGSVLLLDIEFAAHDGVGRCMMCPPDDDSVETPSAIGRCMMCPPDDDTVETTPSVRPLVMWFSRALCKKLRNSGSPNLALANDCALDFFYEHKFGGEETA